MRARGGATGHDTGREGSRRSGRTATLVVGNLIQLSCMRSTSLTRTAVVGDRGRRTKIRPYKPSPWMLGYRGFIMIGTVCVLAAQLES
jgi:hypothetical protein